MHLSKLRVLIWTAAVFIAATLVAACGSNIIATPTPTRTSTGASTSATPALTGLAAQGQQLFVQYQCSMCHSLTGKRIVGPPLNGLYESKVTLSTGQTVTADEAYLKQSILEPDSQIVNGYPSGVMTGHIQQFETDITKDNNHNLDALVAYLESLK